ncbi:hypothetical protein DJ533_18635 [Acinetobacter defluvii]|uniref:Uncharacterized protein n=1 Tax=Acinetobacter defluvii TaxID=1871111 RepID=A0A5B9D580_9GAMM|nr:hypothetical protein DJ533_18635 [Acinetobacter defluvii]
MNFIAGHQNGFAKTIAKLLEGLDEFQLFEYTLILINNQQSTINNQQSTINNQQSIINNCAPILVEERCASALSTT